MTQPPKLTRSEHSFVPGDVLCYLPTQSHCRQGTAIVRSDGCICDTYWGESGYNGDVTHHLSETERASAERLFNVNDYERIGTFGHCAPSDEPKWLEYSPKDRQRIGSQSAHCAVLYVRRGARPDLATKIENAQQKVVEAESNVRSARHRLKWAREDLAKLEAEATRV